MAAADPENRGKAVYGAPQQQRDIVGYGAAARVRTWRGLAACVPSVLTSVRVYV